jgi:hypothetical protein
MLCSSCYQWETFNKAFSLCFPQDPDGTIQKVFDIIKKGSRSFLCPCDLLHSFAYGHGNGADKDLMVVAALAAAVLSWQLHDSFLVGQ